MNFLAPVTTPEELCDRYPSDNYWIVDLNYIRVGVASNMERMPGADYVYAKPANPTVFAEADYRVYLHTSELPDEMQRVWLREHVDRTFRAERFQSGFYVTHHFGAPAYLFARGRDFFVVGATLDKLLWAYFTKLFLTIEAEIRGELHIKAASFALDDQSILLIGRGSGGKTVMLTEAGRRGASFIANTHCVTTPDRVIGIKSPMRVRSDAVFADRIIRTGAKPHIEANEYVLSAHELFRRTQREATPSAICIVDYRSDRARCFEKLSTEQAFFFASLFAFPISTYGLKDDILAWLEGDHFAFCSTVKSMSDKLMKLLQSKPVYYVNADVRDDGDWRRFRNLLLEGSNA